MRCLCQIILGWGLYLALVYANDSGLHQVLSAMASIN